MAFRNRVRMALGHGAGAIWLCASLTGCVTLGSVFDKGHPSHSPARIDVIWQKDLATREDVVHRGQVLKGIAARIYIFGADTGHPVRMDGDISVNAYDTTQVPAGGQPRLLDEWRIPKEILARMAVKDLVGWGYNLFLPVPASKLTPDVRQVNLHLQYTSAKGETLLAPPNTITLGTPATMPVHSMRQAPIPSPIQPATATPAPRWPL